MHIGQLADRVGVNPKTIRYYESITLMPDPERNATGYRLYSMADAERLTFIRTSQRLGLSLEEIRQILAYHERDQPPCGHVLELLQRHVSDLNKRIAEMQNLRDELTGRLKQADGLPLDAGTYCAVLETPHADPAKPRS